MLVNATQICGMRNANSVNAKCDLKCKHILLVNRFTSYFADDFKPASVDSSKPSELTVGSKNDITVKVPNVQVQYIDNCSLLFVLYILCILAWSNTCLFILTTFRRCVCLQ